MRAYSRDSRLLRVSILILFAVMAALAAFIIVGESRRSRILAEYEADRLASALMESMRSQEGSSVSSLDRRVLGFGLYDNDGSLVMGFGEAPSSIDRTVGMSSFSYDESGKRLAMTRQLGVGGMGGMGGRSGRNGTLQRAMRQMMPATGMGSGFLYLSLDVSDYFRRRSILGVSAVLAPLAIIGLALVFLRLFASNERLRRAAEERETLARLGESARTLAHEIRNPLGAIRIQTGLVRQRLQGESWPEIDAIEEETERLAALSRRVSDFLKNPAGSPRLVELGPFLAELAARSPYRPRCSGEGLPAAALIDPELLRSAIDNLLRNASESYAGDVGEVELVLAVEADRALVSVLDRGRGIAKGDMGKAFDPFYTDKVQGSGIGLPLARRFVEAAGGTLALSSREGGGTEARISLPLAEEA